MEFTVRLIQYIGRDPDLSSGWDCGFSYNCGSNCSSGGSSGGSGGGGGGGEAIWEGEPTVLT